MKYLAMGIIGVVLLISLYSDIRYRKIYNKVTFPVFITGFFISLSYSFLYGKWMGLGKWFFGFMIGVVCSWAFEKGALWAAGDSKLFLACLLWLMLFVHPLIASAALAGAVLFLHFGLNVVLRLMKFYTVRITWFNKRLPKGQYPGAITIALAVLLVVVI